MLKNNIFNSVKEFLLKNKLNGEKLVLAVSGGADSMVLLSVLRELGLNEIIVVHFDHQVRENSYKDFDLIQSYCNEFEIKLILKKLEFENMANFEAEARLLRYKELEQIRIECSASYIVTAHNMDDCVETILHKFLKGTFVTGLAGICAVDLERKLVRPLLGVKKAEVYEFAKSYGVEFNEDESNKDLKYDRNFLRHKIVPELEGRYVGFQNQLLEKASFYAELNSWILESASMMLADEKKYLDVFAVYEVESIVGVPSFLRFEWLQLKSGIDLSVARYLEFEKFLLTAQNGKSFRIGDYVIEKCFNYLVFVPVEFDFGQLFLEKSNYEIAGLDLNVNDYFYEMKIPSFLRSLISYELIKSDKIVFSVDIEKFVLNSDNIR